MSTSVIPTSEQQNETIAKGVRIIRALNAAFDGLCENCQEKIKQSLVGELQPTSSRHDAKSQQ